MPIYLGLGPAIRNALACSSPVAEEQLGVQCPRTLWHVKKRRWGSNRPTLWFSLPTELQLLPPFQPSSGVKMAQNKAGTCFVCDLFFIHVACIRFLLLYICDVIFFHAADFSFFSLFLFCLILYIFYIFLILVYSCSFIPFQQQLNPVREFSILVRHVSGLHNVLRSLYGQC